MIDPGVQQGGTACLALMKLGTRSHVSPSIIVEVRTAKDYMGAFGSDGYLYDFAKERIPSHCFQFSFVFFV